MSKFSISSSRLTAFVAGTLSLAACTIAFQAPSAGAAALTEGPLVPLIVGGQESSISQFPWQVLVERFAEGSGAACGGSILNATTILTAAHCVDHEGSTATYPAADFVIAAGDSNLGAPSPTLQLREVASVRAHPYYNPLPNIKDDAAVLTLKEPLNLSPATNAQAIGIVAAGATPPAGTTLSVSGYGKQEGPEGASPNGKLYSTTLTAMSSDACGRAVEEVANSAVLLCAIGANSSTCQGDSGGPLTEGNPAVQVGLVDIGPHGCPVGEPDGFTNLAAPEVRAFIEGSETPPVAARPTALPTIRSVGVEPVDFSPLACEPGGWSGSPSFTYTFQVDNAAAQAFQSGPTNIFTPPSALVGAPLVCIVQASNAGGVTTVRTATTLVAADTMRPAASITALKCEKQACTISIAAFDPNAVPISLEPSGGYAATVKCPAKKSKKKNKGKKQAKAPVCHATKTVKMSLKSLSAGVYSAAVSHLPYSRKLTFTVAVTDAAGLRPPVAPVVSTTLRPPSKNKKKKTTAKNRKPGKKKHNAGSNGPAGSEGPVGLTQ